MNGYEELRTSAAWIDLSPRGRIRLTGEDRVRLVHAMSTNHVEQLKPGEGCPTFFLNAQGRILCDSLIFCLDDSLLLDTEPETAAKLFEHLDQFIIADDAVPENISATLGAIGVDGPGAGEALTARGLALPANDFGIAVQPEGRMVAKVAVTGQNGYVIYGPAESQQTFAESLGIPQADDNAVRTARIENGKPRYGEEITERYLVQETGLMNLISFQKGCYLGQEIVERVRSRGQVHRHLKFVDIQSDTPPQAGVKLTADGKDSGELASAVYSPAAGHCVGFAYVRTDAAKPGTNLSIGSTGVTVR